MWAKVLLIVHKSFDNLLLLMEENITSWYNIGDCVSSEEKTHHKSNVS